MDFLKKIFNKIRKKEDIKSTVNYNLGKIVFSEDYGDVLDKNLVVENGNYEDNLSNIDVNNSGIGTTQLPSPNVEVEQSPSFKLEQLVFNYINSISTIINDPRFKSVSKLYFQYYQNPNIKNNIFESFSQAFPNFFINPTIYKYIKNSDTYSKEFTDISLIIKKYREDMTTQEILFLLDTIKNIGHIKEIEHEETVRSIVDNDIHVVEEQDSLVMAKYINSIGGILKDSEFLDLVDVYNNINDPEVSNNVIRSFIISYPNFKFDESISQIIDKYSSNQDSLESFYDSLLSYIEIPEKSFIFLMDVIKNYQNIKGNSTNEEEVQETVKEEDLILAKVFNSKIETIKKAVDLGLRNGLSVEDTLKNGITILNEETGEEEKIKLDDKQVMEISVFVKGLFYNRYAGQVGGDEIVGNSFSEALKVFTRPENKKNHVAISNFMHQFSYDDILSNESLMENIEVMRDGMLSDAPNESDKIINLDLRNKKDLIAFLKEYNSLYLSARSSIDFRMNFFIKYPNYLSDVVDEEFYLKMKKFIGSLVDTMGVSKVWNGDLASLPSCLGNNAVHHRARFCDFLLVEKGEELLNKLQSLINDLNPDVFSFVNRRAASLIKNNKDVSDVVTVMGNDDDDSYEIEQGDNEARSKDFRKDETTGIMSSEITEEERDKAKQSIANVTKSYLEKRVESIDFIKKNLFESSIDKYSDMILNRKEDVGLSGAKISKIYNAFEISNLFLKKIMSLYDNFSQFNKVEDISIKDSDGGFYLKSEFGSFFIPVDVLKKIFNIKKDTNVINHYIKRGFDVRKLDISNPKDFESIIKIYKDIYKEDPFSDSLLFDKGDSEDSEQEEKDINDTRFISYNIARNNIVFLGGFKKIILDYKKRNEGLEAESILFNLSHSISDFLNNLDYVSNVRSDDPVDVINKKRLNFIKITIEQSYKSGIVEDAELLKKIDEKIRNNEKLDSSEKSLYKSSMVRLREGFLFVLPELYNFVKENKESGNEIDNTLIRFILNTYLSKDINEYARFSNNGRKTLGEKTYTEMYYELMGQEVPSNIMSRIDVYKSLLSKERVVSLSGDKKSKQNKREELNIDVYEEFFGIYDKYVSMKRKHEINKRYLAEYEDEKQTKEDLLNTKMTKYLDHLLSSNKFNEDLTQEYVLKMKDMLQSEDRIRSNGNTQQVEIFEKEKYRLCELLMGVGHFYEEKYTSLKGTYKSLNTINMKIRNLKKTIEDIENYYAIMNAKMEESIFPVLGKDIPDFDSNSLKLARRVFENVIKKASAFEKICNSNIKIAFAGEINKQIDKLYKDFDDFFKGLFF